jgi:hypothetical protein
MVKERCDQLGHGLAPDFVEIVQRQYQLVGQVGQFVG